MRHMPTRLAMLTALAAALSLAAMPAQAKRPRHHHRHPRPAATAPAAAPIAAPTTAATPAPAATPVAAPVAPSDTAAEAERARLNAEQAELARKQIEGNAASQQAHDDAEAARRAAVQAHDEAVARQAAEAAKQKADYDAAVKKWEQDVALCKKGKREHCAPPVKK